MSGFPFRMRTGRRMLCAFLLFALAPPAVQAQQPRHPSSDDPDSLSTQEGLTRAANGQIGPLEAFTFLKRAARSDDPASISILKRLAMRYAEDGNLSRYSEHLDYSSIAHTAMYALWKKGVPRSYFLSVARRHEQDKWPAFYTASILAIHPEAETLDLIQKMRACFDDAYIDGVHNAMLYADGRFEEYRQMTSLEEKADFLIEWAGRGARVIGLSGGWDWDSEHHLHPAAIRAREELRSFSKQHPAVVAQQLAEVRLEYGNTQRYQRLVAQSLAEPSHAELTHLWERQRRTSDQQ